MEWSNKLSFGGKIIVFKSDTHKFILKNLVRIQEDTLLILQVFIVRNNWLLNSILLMSTTCFAPYYV